MRIKDTRAEIGELARERHTNESAYINKMVLERKKLLNFFISFGKSKIKRIVKTFAAIKKRPMLPSPTNWFKKLDWIKAGKAVERDKISPEKYNMIKPALFLDIFFFFVGMVI